MEMARSSSHLDRAKFRWSGKYEAEHSQNFEFATSVNSRVTSRQIGQFMGSRASMSSSKRP